MHKIILLKFLITLSYRTGLSRLVIVILNPGHSFASLKQVQDEISPIMNELYPKNCSNVPCPFMTDGDDLGGKFENFLK